MMPLDPAARRSTSRAIPRLAFWRMALIGAVSFVLGVLLGLVGLGAAPPAEHSDPANGLTVTFPRVLVLGHERAVVIEAAAEERPLRLRLSLDWLAAMGASEPVPAPISRETDGEAQIYEFRPPVGTVTFTVSPRRMGFVAGEIGRADTPPILIEHYVLP